MRCAQRGFPPVNMREACALAAYFAHFLADGVDCFGEVAEGFVFAFEGDFQAAPFLEYLVDGHAFGDIVIGDLHQREPARAAGFGDVLEGC